MFLFYIKTLLLSTDFVNSGGVVYAIGELVDLFNEKVFFFVKGKKTAHILRKTFLHCLFLSLLILCFCGIRLILTALCGKI